MVGVLLTLFVVAAGGAGGLVLLLADDATRIEALAYASPAPAVAPTLQPLPESAELPMASLDGLRDLAPPAPEAPAVAPPGTSPEAAPASAPDTERRTPRRNVRRARRVQADASDGFRRARRVGRDRL